MDHERRCMRLCAAVLALAVVLRLGAAGGFATAGRWLATPEAASVLLYLQTGRVVRLAREQPLPPVLHRLTRAEPEAPPEPEIASPEFSEADLEGIRMYYSGGYRPELAPLLTQPLELDLRGPEPKVLIVHTHTCESYTPEFSGQYEPSGDFRTLDPQYNVLAVGELVAGMLESAGIGVVQDREFHDYPSYNHSYLNTKASTEEILAANPSIELILDLHRDAADTPAGQLVTACSVGGETAAQLMMVVGTDECGLEHPRWRDNLAVALKLQTLLERSNPGICRKLTLTDQRYNQHLGKNALLIEVGAAGNTLREAKLAAAELAKAIIALSRGSQ